MWDILNPTFTVISTVAFQAETEAAKTAALVTQQWNQAGDPVVPAHVRVNRHDIADATFVFQVSPDGTCKGPIARFSTAAQDEEDQNWSAGATFTTSLESLLRRLKSTRIEFGFFKPASAPDPFSSQAPASTASPAQNPPAVQNPFAAFQAAVSTASPAQNPPANTFSSNQAPVSTASPAQNPPAFQASNPFSSNQAPASTAPPAQNPPAFQVSNPFPPATSAPPANQAPPAPFNFSFTPAPPAPPAGQATNAFASNSFTNQTPVSSAPPAQTPVAFQVPNFQTSQSPPAPNAPPAPAASPFAAPAPATITAGAPADPDAAALPLEANAPVNAVRPGKRTHTQREGDILITDQTSSNVKVASTAEQHLHMNIGVDVGVHHMGLPLMAFMKNPGSNDTSSTYDWCCIIVQSSGVRAISGEIRNFLADIRGRNEYPIIECQFTAAVFIILEVYHQNFDKVQGSALALARFCTTAQLWNMQDNIFAVLRIKARVQLSSGSRGLTTTGTQTLERLDSLYANTRTGEGTNHLKFYGALADLKLKQGN